MNAEIIITEALGKVVEKLYGSVPAPELLQVQTTRKEFEGDYTVVVFPLLRISRKSPEQTGSEIGREILDSLPEIESFQVIKGFLNLKMSSSYWMNRLQDIALTKNYGMGSPSGRTEGDPIP